MRSEEAWELWWAQCHPETGELRGTNWAEETSLPGVSGFTWNRRMSGEGNILDIWGRRWKLTAQKSDHVQSCRKRPNTCSYVATWDPEGFSFTSPGKLPLSRSKIIERASYLY